MQELKVGHVFKTYFPESFGGVETIIDELARGLVEYNIRSRVISTAGSTSNPNLDMPSANGYDVVTYRRTLTSASTPLSLDMLLNYRAYTDDVDILHYHFPWPYMDFVHQVRRIGKPYIITYHSDIVKQKKLNLLYGPLMKTFLSNANAIVATSDEYRSTSPVLKHFETSVIPLGISEPKQFGDQQHFNNPLAHPKTPERYFLTIGAHRHYKGLELLVDAAEQITDHIIIATSGANLSSLRERIKAREATNVTLLESVSDNEKFQLIRNCLAFVLPSINRAEAFGIALVEAASAGKPLITFELETGTSFVNRSGLTGIVVPEISATALANAVNELSRNPQALEKYGRGARERYTHYLTSDIMCGAYAALYRSILR